MIEHAHAWVMYLNERGRWELLEPFAHVNGGTGRALHGRILLRVRRSPMPRISVLNRDHLWRVESNETYQLHDFPEYVRAREQKFWKGFKPKFALDVHYDIYREALDGMSLEDVRTVNAVNEQMDVENVVTGRYDPRDHCDFALIAESWDRIGARLKTGDLEDFGRAIHTVSDFYAHSTYCEAAPKGAGGLPPLFVPGMSLAAPNVTYDFSTRSNRCTHGLDEIQQHWNKTVVTGHWWRPVVGVPSEIASDESFPWRLCLPDHNHLAVDSFAGWTQGHHNDLQSYQQQFVLRRKMAIQHVRAIYQEWMQTHP